MNDSTVVVPQQRPAVDVDYARLFDGLPTPYLVLTPTAPVVIVGANAAYLRTVGRSRGEIVGRPAFEVFPPVGEAAEDETEDRSGVRLVQASIDRVCRTGRPDTAPIVRYDLVDPATGRQQERFWSLIHAPIFGIDGGVALIVQRAEDVTDYLQARAHQEDPERAEAWRRRAEEVEADLHARGQELGRATRAKQVAGRRLAGLAAAALRLTTADSVEDLAAVVFGAGLPVLGAHGGGVAVRDPASGDLVLTFTDSLGEDNRQAYSEIPLDGPLPVSIAARGTPVVVPDLEAGESYPGLPEGMRISGSRACAALPLRAGGRLLGSLVVSWSEEHHFPPEEVELLQAFAAQCATALDRLQTRAAERSAAAELGRMSETLQRSLLSDPPQPDDLQFAVRYRPAAQDAQVGGDWYDAFVLPGGVTCLAIGDVAGHDRDAAAAMGAVRNILRGIAYARPEAPAGVLTRLDGAIRDLGVGALATAIVARIEQDEADAAAGVRFLRWSNAGHPPPLMLHPDGSVETLGTTADLLLGLDPSSERADHVQVLRPGAAVLLYTDGLIERRGATIDDGLEWLRRVAAEMAGLELEDFCDALLSRVEGDVEDDIALLALRVHAGN